MPDSAELDVHGLVKPILRGRIHAAALVAALPAGVVLVVRASGPTSRIASAVYAATLVGLFAASSAYHRLGGTPSRTWLRRLDHSSIFLLIAGSYTPVCLVALSGWGAGLLLATVWAVAVVGVVLKLVLFDRFHRLGFALYLTMGWAVIAVLPRLVTELDAGSLVLFAAGGVTYTLGAIVLATRVPNPLPRVFGYHEVWHVMVVVAAALHYIAISGVVTS